MGQDTQSRQQQCGKGDAKVHGRGKRLASRHAPGDPRTMLTYSLGVTVKRASGGVN
jgi:hypothetical protein